MSSPQFVVGLTGGIGSGKSEVGRAFAALGVEIADADLAAHAVSANGTPGHAAVATAFGPEAIGPDGELDRGWLRRCVFADGEARSRLERILHPLVYAYLNRVIASWHGAYGVLIVPLLLERGGLAERVSRVLVVDCAEDEQVRRVVARSGLPPEEVRSIMATQLPRAQRLKRADDVIDNNGPAADIAPQVMRLDEFYRECARQGNNIGARA